MKHLYRAVIVLLASAGTASAASFADINQDQGQFDGGLAGAIPFASGQIGGGAGAQGMDAFVASDTLGDSATTGQFQQQAMTGAVAEGTATSFAASSWATAQEQTAETATFGGFAGQAQEQAIIGGSAGLSIGGQFGVAGSAGYAEAEAGSFALGLAGATNEQGQGMATAYAIGSASPNGGFIEQTGSQQFGTSTTTESLVIGAAGAEASVLQAGGSLVTTDGQGGSTNGEATAFGTADAGAGALGLAGAEAEAFGTQTHSYEAVNISADGSNQQLSTGTVSTTVGATAP